jgi:hypothetical protein
MDAEEHSEAPMTSLTTPITIRLATDDDRLGLTRLAALDSAEAAPPGRVLLAEVDGELRAALSLADGSAIADPFHPTLAILELLRTHAAAQSARRERHSLRLRLRFALG